MISRKISTVFAAVAVLGVLGLGQAQSQSTGKIAVTLVDAAGAPVTDTEIKLDTAAGGASAAQLPGAPGASGGSGSAGKSAAGGTRLLLSEPVRVATVKTDKDGKAEFANLKKATYRVSVTDAHDNITAFATVKVEPGKTVKADLKLRKR